MIKIPFLYHNIFLLNNANPCRMVISTSFLSLLAIAAIWVSSLSEYRMIALLASCIAIFCVGSVCFIVSCIRPSRRPRILGFNDHRCFPWSIIGILDKEDLSNWISHRKLRRISLPKDSVDKIAKEEVAKIVSDTFWDYLSKHSSSYKIVENSIDHWVVPKIVPRAEKIIRKAISTFIAPPYCVPFGYRQDNVSLAIHVARSRKEEIAKLVFDEIEISVSMLLFAEKYMPKKSEAEIIKAAKKLY